MLFRNVNNIQFALVHMDTVRFQMIFKNHIYSTFFFNFCFRRTLEIFGCDKATSKLYMTNGYILAFMFFTARICVIPTYWMQVYSVFGTPSYLRMAGVIQYVHILVPLLLDTMNIYWASRIIRGALKLLGITGGDSKKVE